MNPNHPVYIISRGRWETRKTSKALEHMHVPYKIVIDSDQYENYASVISREKILTVALKYYLNYDTCDRLSEDKSKGPGGARNYCWDHSIREGHSWHWVMDDNIDHFARVNNNKRVRCADGTIFRCMEDFCERYVNVAMAGPAYRGFTPVNQSKPPFVINTRIYSCNLIRNDAPFRWRGRYNEDTILSLDMLKAGWCTIQFNAFLQDKATTQRFAGGNTDEFYAKEGTLPKSLMQIAVHPDVSRLAWRRGHWHHYVDYRKFKSNRLIRKENFAIKEKIDDYGMNLVSLHDSM